MSMFEYKSKLATAKTIILTLAELRLFGSLLYSFDIDFIESTEPFARVYYNEHKKRLVIEISSEMCATYNINNLAFILVHEISHPLLKHLDRGRKFDNREIANIAMDHVINYPLSKDIANGKIKGIKVPEDAVIINSIKDENMSMEEIYEYLNQHATVETMQLDIMSEPNDENDSGDNSSQTGDSNSNEESDGGENDEGDGDGEEENDGEGNSSSESESSSNPKPGKNVGKGTITKIKVKLPDGQKFEIIKDIDVDINENSLKTEKEIQDNARRLINSELFKQSKDRMKGNGSSDFFDMITEELKVEIPWDELLENVIKKYVKEPSNNKTWARLNKRLMSHNYILPSFNDDEKFENLYIIIDTSGSISGDDLKKFVNIIRNSTYHFKNVIKIDHDTQIKNVTVFNSEEIDQLAEGMTFSGRGGTSHRDVYILLEHIFNGDYVYSDLEDKEPGLILFLTDFMSDIQHIHAGCKWVQEYPYKYILTENVEVDPAIDKSPIYIK